MRPQSCDVWEPETTFWFAIIKVGTAVTPIFRLCALLSFISSISESPIRIPIQQASVYIAVHPNLTGNITKCVVISNIDGVAEI